MALVIEKQESLACEKYTKNGKNKNLFFVAKNIPFNISIGSQTVNLNTALLHCSLFYDFDDGQTPKEVETLKNAAMQYVAHITPQGNHASIEFRVHTLSSQHEGAFYRIKISIDDNESKKRVEVFSHPIKVISKRNQVKRKLENREVEATDPLPVPKRTTTDVISEALHKLTEQQQEHSRLLKYLVEKEKVKAVPAIVKVEGTSASFNTAEDFEAAFKNFLAAYRRLPANERPTKIRKISQTSQDDGATLAQFVQVYTDSLPSSPLLSSPPQSDSQVVGGGSNPMDLASLLVQGDQRIADSKFDDFYGGFDLEDVDIRPSRDARS